MAKTTRDYDGVSIPVTFSDGDGIITVLFDDEGDKTTNPADAVAAVARMLSGPHAGKWRSFDVTSEDFKPTKVH